MPQGIICVFDPAVFKDHFDLTIDPALIDLGKLKEALLLPDRYTVEQVRHRPFYRNAICAEIIVSSPDIPESQGEMPNVTPCYLSSTDSEAPKTYTISLQDILINGVSAIKEEDKERKRTIEVKEVKDVSVNTARDTQFSGFAKALFDKLYDQFNNLHYQEDDGEEAKAERTRKGILETIAEAGPALVVHVLCDHKDIQWQPLESISMAEITDLTEWPSNP